LRIFLQRIEKRMDFFEKGFLMDNYRELGIDLYAILKEAGVQGEKEGGDAGSDDQDR
jgi:hypothetical protein